MKPIFLQMTLISLILSACSSQQLPDLTDTATQAVRPPTSTSADPAPAFNPTLSPTLSPGHTLYLPINLSPNLVDPSPVSLRTFADQWEFFIGAAVDSKQLANDPTYAQILSREFNMVTAENEMKFGPIHPQPTEYNFTAADSLVDFAEAHGMQVRGHTLVWSNQLPAWVSGQTWTQDQLVEILQDHILTVVSRYRGRIGAWDVVNEAFTREGKLAETIWLQTIGPEYIELAFQWAHEADPEALLFYNDTGAEGITTKSDAIYEFVSDLIARGIPIHGIGLQFHTTIQSAPAPAELEENINRFAELGLVVHITEMDVRLKEPVTDADAATQVMIYEQTLRTCLNTGACTALVFWGLTDKHSWIPHFYEGWGAALPFDENYNRKPAYDGLIRALNGGG